VIVRVGADGAVVEDADDCSDVRLETDLPPDRLRAALRATGSAAPGAGEDDPDAVVLDLAVLRSRARLLAPDPGWPDRFAALVAGAGDRLTPGGLGLRVPVDRR
jgi:hypothetical protein